MIQGRVIVGLLEDATRSHPLGGNVTLRTAKHEAYMMTEVRASGIGVATALRI
jgi:signal transduction histidine kinase